MTHKRAYIISGPQSHGNHLLVDLLHTAGIPINPHMNHDWQQPTLAQGLEYAPELITFDRSTPYDGDWDALTHAIIAAESHGYTVTVISPVRAQDAAELSLIARGHAPDLETAALLITKAWKTIFAATEATAVEHLLIPTHALADPRYLTWLAKTLGLLRDPANIYRDEDAKHRLTINDGYQFTFDWTSCHVADWNRWLVPYRAPVPLRILTVGAAEGRSEIWLLANLAVNPLDTVTTIEPGYVADWHRRLLHNHSIHPARARWHLIQKPSSIALPNLIHTGTLFDVIYLDADHEEHCSYADTLNAWHLLRRGGTLIIDDVAYRDARNGEGAGQALRYALPEFHEQLTIEVSVNGTKGQAMIRKHERWDAI